MTDTADFAKEVRELRAAALEADKENREEAKTDLEFRGLKQWDETVRQQRESAATPLPCLTIDMTGSLIGQVTGDRLANATSIKALPTEDGDKDIADIRSELIRSIEHKSKADRVYEQTFHNQVACGIGNLRVDIDYASDETFDRDIFIRGIPNPLAVIWDPMSADPTGRDAEYCFVEERMRKETYKAKFGEEASTSLNDGGDYDSDWFDGNTVRVLEYHKITTEKRTIAMFMDGSVKDITKLDPSQMPGQILINPSTGQPYQREIDCKYATRILTNGQEKLEDEFKIKLFRLPIIRAVGHDIWVGDKRIRFGLIRQARDPQRLKNYLRSVAAEKLMLSPRHNYIGPAKAFQGREADWPNALMYNDSAPIAPQETTQNNLAALMQMAEMFSQDMKDVTGLHDASLGMRSNETSGIAIQRRQHEGDIATIIFPKHFNYTLEEAGEVVNAFIPQTHDTVRTVRLLGEDESVKLQRINDPNDPNSVNLATGNYDIRISTGPAYMTRRQEAASSMVEAGSATQGKLWEVAGDLMVDAMDWPGADKIKERLKKTLPPELRDEEDEQPDPAAMQAKMEAEAMQREMAMLEHRKATAEAVKAEAEARKAAKEAEDAEAGLNKQTVDATNAETARIKAITAKDFPLPASAQAILAPLVTQAVMNVLQSPDVLPLAVQAGIAADAFDEATQPTPEQIAAMQQPEQSMGGEFQ